MAPICQRPEARWGFNSPPRLYMEGAKTSLRISSRKRCKQRGLQSLLSGAKARWSVRQHRQNGTSPIARMSFSPLRQRQHKDMASASLATSCKMAVKGSSSDNIKRLRNSAHIPFYNIGNKYRGKGRGDMRVNLGSYRLYKLHPQFHATGSDQDKQKSRGSADECKFPHCVRRGSQRAVNGSCYRVQLEARSFGQEGIREAFKGNWNTFFSPCIPTHLRGMDGARRCSHAKNSSISRSHHNSSHRAGLRQIFPVIYEGCQPSSYLVKVQRYMAESYGLTKNRRIMVLLGRIELPTSSLPMQGLDGKLPFIGLFTRVFGQYSAILLYFRQISCTYGTLKNGPAVRQDYEAHQTQRNCE